MFLSLFHQVMGVKKMKMLKEKVMEIVSIPFSSGHGGKETKSNGWRARDARFYPFFIRSWG